MVKEAWETKRDTLEKTGNVVIEQLREALSAKASSQDVRNDLADVSVDQCVEKVREVLHYIFLDTIIMISSYMNYWRADA